MDLEGSCELLSFLTPSCEKGLGADDVELAAAGLGCAGSVVCGFGVDEDRGFEPSSVGGLFSSDLGVEVPSLARRLARILEVYQQP